ncbi:hypothetical protein L837_2906 [Mycobacterium avium MAV_061107_1842]|nr:hypothetical protein L837_2906 [Mycobacterium avium MAV_061107_1842]
MCFPASSSVNPGRRHADDTRRGATPNATTTHSTHSTRTA